MHGVCEPQSSPSHIDWPQQKEKSNQDQIYPWLTAFVIGTHTSMTAPSVSKLTRGHTPYRQLYNFSEKSRLNIYLLVQPFIEHCWAWPIACIKSQLLQNFGFNDLQKKDTF